MIIVADGFGLCVNPEQHVNAVVKSGVKVLAAAPNDVGVDDFGLGKLLATRQIRKLLSSYTGENAEFMRHCFTGEVEPDPPGGRWPNGCAPEAAASPAFTPGPVSRPGLPRARPTLFGNCVGHKGIALQSENGMFGMGPFPIEGKKDPDLINTGKQTIAEFNRSSYFDRTTRFGMIRGRKIVAAIPGAMETAEHGDLANRMTPGTLVKGMVARWSPWPVWGQCRARVGPVSLRCRAGDRRVG